LGIYNANKSYKGPELISHPPTPVKKYGYHFYYGPFSAYSEVSLQGQQGSCIPSTPL
jgi:hypothetical protein